MLDGNLHSPETLAPQPVRLGESPRAEWAFLGVAMVLALLLRLHGIANRPFWVDEAATLGIGRLSFREILDLVFPVEANPPGYYVLMKFWYDLGGGSETWMRLPSALAGAAVLVPFYLFCRRAFGRPAAVCGAVLLALTAQHLRFSQEARNYALMFLVFVLGLLVTQTLLRDPPPPVRWRWLLAGLLAVLTATLLYLHATGVIAAASIFVYGGVTLLAARRATPRRLAPLIGAGLGGLVLAIPWLLVAFYIAFSPASVMHWQPPLTAETVLWTLHQTLLAWNLHKLFWPAVIATIGALLAALVLRRREPQVWGVFAALVFGLASFPLISMAVEPIIFERTLLFLTALTTALVAACLGTPGHAMLRGALALMLLLSQARAIEIHYRTNHYGELWDTVAQRIMATAKDDAVLAVGVFDAVTIREYLRRLGHDGQVAVLGLGHEAPYAPLTQAMLAPPAAWMDVPDSFACSALAATPGVWVIGREKPLGEREPELAAALERSGAVRSEVQLIGKLRLEHWSAVDCPTDALPRVAAGGKAPGDGSPDQPALP